jgi:hypothetical protein
MKLENVRERPHSSFGPLHVVFQSLYLQPSFVCLTQWDQGRIKAETQRGEMYRRRCNKMRSRDFEQGQKRSWNFGEASQYCSTWNCGLLAYHQDRQWEQERKERDRKVRTTPFLTLLRCAGPQSQRLEQPPNEVDEQRSVANAMKRKPGAPVYGDIAVWFHFATVDELSSSYSQGNSCVTLQRQYFVRRFKPLLVANYVASNGRIRHEQWAENILDERILPNQGVIRTFVWEAW